MHFTPEICKGAYEYLRTTPPFRRWGLPHGDNVKFLCRNSRKGLGWHWHKNGDQHTINIAANLISYHDQFLRVMAHEMVHLYQAVAGRETHNVIHNADFHELAKRVCKEHGFDPKYFV